MSSSSSGRHHHRQITEPSLSSIRDQELQFKRLTEELGLARISQATTTSTGGSADKRLKRRSYSVYENACSTDRRLQQQVKSDADHQHHHNQQKLQEIGSDTESKLADYPVASRSKTTTTTTPASNSNNNNSSTRRRRRRAASSLGIPTFQSEHSKQDRPETSFHQMPYPVREEEGMTSQQHHHHLRRGHPMTSSWHHNQRRHNVQQVGSNNSGGTIYHHNYQQHVNRMMELQQRLYQEDPYHHPMIVRSDYHHQQLQAPPINHHHHHTSAGGAYYQPLQGYQSEDLYQHHHQHHRQQYSPIMSPTLHNNHFFETSTPRHHHNQPRHQQRRSLIVTSQQPLHVTPNRHHHQLAGVGGSTTTTVTRRSKSARSQVHKQSDQLYLSDNFSSVKISQVIEMLHDRNPQTISNAAAYMQHITYGDDVMKSLLRKKHVIPVLVRLLHHSHIEVQRSACGAVRNLVYKNVECKLLVEEERGIRVLCDVMSKTGDLQLKQLVTSVLWNMSSCDALKARLSDQCLRHLCDRVVIAYARRLDPIRMSAFASSRRDDDVAALPVTSRGSKLDASDVAIEEEWSTLFLNSTGCLRNLSSGSEAIRDKLRGFPGLVESLLLVVENVIGKNDIDSTNVENVVCILRNISYHITTTTDAATPTNPTDQSYIDSSEEDGKSAKSEADCWRIRSSSKKAEKAKNKQETLSTLMEIDSNFIRGGALLSHPSVVRRYLALLAETCNNSTLEAAAGALQNISAGDGLRSRRIRTTVRKMKGLAMLVEFLHMRNDKIVAVVAATLRNMSLDDRNKHLIGKHALRDFVAILPDSSSSSLLRHHDESDVIKHQQQQALRSRKLEEILACLLELLRGNQNNAQHFCSLGGAKRVVELRKLQAGESAVSRKSGGLCARILSELWKWNRSRLKRDGWAKSDFVVAKCNKNNLNSTANTNEMPRRHDNNLTSQSLAMTSSSASSSADHAVVTSQQQHHHPYLLDSWV